MRRSVPVLVLVILLVAYGVRVYHLGTQSFWYDEGVALGHSQRALLDMIPMLQRNVHVPAYFASLALWEDFTGKSEFALRYLSLIFSVLSVAFTFALGKRLFGGTAGIVASGFVALNTFSIYYAQEARMYAMLAMVGACSMWVFVGFTRAYQRQDRIFIYALILALVNALGIYTHFSYALVMVAQGIMATLWLLALLVGNIRLDNPERRITSRLIREGLEPIYTIGTTIRSFLIYLIANLITIALFFPWLEIALRQTGSQPNISDVLQTNELFRIFQGWLTFGNTFADNAGSMAIAFYFILLFGLALLPLRQRGQWWNMLLPIIWVIVSVLLYSYLNLYGRYLRFLLPAQVGMALWAGRGAWVLWHLRPRRYNRVTVFIVRFATVFAVCALWLTMAQGIPLLNENKAYQRDDYRGLAQLISNQADRDDAVILSAAGLQEIFGYYYTGKAPVYPLPIDQDPADDVQFIALNSQDIYVVFYGEREQDPQGIVEKTLNTLTFPLTTQWWDDLRFAHYVTSPSPIAQETLEATFDTSIMLVSVGLNSTSFTRGNLQPLLIDATWQTDTILDTRYKIFVQVLDSNGILVAQRDSEPLNGSLPTIDWQPNTLISDHHGIELEALAPGDYTLIFGLYDPTSGIRLSVKGADYLTLGTITILN